MAERALATVMGAVAGLVSYLAWAYLYPGQGGGEAWSLSGPAKWWVLTGALLGLMGGLALARAVLDHVVEDTRQEASITIVVGIAVIAVVGCALAVLWFSMR